jgi:hypothetical protein
MRSANIEYGKQGLTDMPIPMVNAAQAYIDAKIPHWVYYCCAPQGPWLNRFLDTPLPKVRMSGIPVLPARRQGISCTGGFNYWHKMEREDIGDPFNDRDERRLPRHSLWRPVRDLSRPRRQAIDSIRWEVFASRCRTYAIPPVRRHQAGRSDSSSM